MIIIIITITVAIDSINVGEDAPLHDGAEACARR